MGATFLARVRLSSTLDLKVNRLSRVLVTRMMLLPPPPGRSSSSTSPQLSSLSTCCAIAVGLTVAEAVGEEVPASGTVQATKPIRKATKGAISWLPASFRPIDQVPFIQALLPDLLINGQ